MSEHSVYPVQGNVQREHSFQLLSELHKTPDLTQRELALRLNISLGKTNYLIRQLIKKGIVKMNNFSRNPGKIRKTRYILTPKGIKEKLSLTYYFLKRKEAEYNLIKKEWDVLVSREQAESIGRRG